VYICLRYTFARNFKSSSLIICYSSSSHQQPQKNFAWPSSCKTFYKIYSHNRRYISKSGLQLYCIHIQFLEIIPKVQKLEGPKKKHSIDFRCEEWNSHKGMFWVPDNNLVKHPKSLISTQSFDIFVPNILISLTSIPSILFVKKEER